jgi:hypothetical protein
MYSPMTALKRVVSGDKPQFGIVELYIVRYGYTTCSEHKRAANRENSVYLVLYGLKWVVSREAFQFGIFELYLVQYG